MGVLSFHIFKSFYLNKKQVTPILIIGILLFIVFSLNFFNLNAAIIREYRFLTFGFPSFLIITSFSILERLGVFNLGNGILSKLGDASYVMYLIHSPIVSFFSIIMPISLYNIGMVFLFLIVSFLSLFLYFFMDYPIYKKLKNL